MLGKILSLGVLVGLVLLFLYDTRPSNEAFVNCLSKTRSSYSAVNRLARERNMNHARKCSTAQEQLLSGRQCFQDIIDKRFTARFLFMVSDYRRDLKTIFRQHNQSCSRYDVPSIDLGIVPEK